MLMLMLMAALVVVLMMMVVMALAAGVVALVPGVLGQQGGKLVGDGVFLLDGIEKLLPAELVPRSRDDDGVGILLPHDGNGLLGLFGRDLPGAAENDAVRGAELVDEKLAEILSVELGLRSVHHGAEPAQRGVFKLRRLDGGHHVRKLAHAARLDEDAVGRILGHDHAQCLPEIAGQTAADAAGVHLVDHDARIGHEAAVNADLAELVLDEDELLSAIRLREQLFDERGLAGA